MAIKQCITEGCKNKRGNGRICHKCHSRKVRSNNPIKYAYDTLKFNAKRRGRHFTITLDYFKKLIEGTNYIHAKGRTKLALQIDRIDNELGYVPGNLRVITQEENQKAYREFLKKMSQEEGGIILNAHLSDEEMPF